MYLSGMRNFAFALLFVVLSQGLFLLDGFAHLSWKDESVLAHRFSLDYVINNPTRYSDVLEGSFSMDFLNAELAHSLEGF
ncbi:MAG TPA: hypothetical protein PLV25_07425, partial [Opitutales bacterium]|nr:hypothetical protein [Opitutales bacterium]